MDQDLESRPWPQRSAGHRVLAFQGQHERDVAWDVLCRVLQSDGTYVFGKLIWKERSYSPLSGFAKILRDQKFSELSDEKKQGLFLELLQQSYGQLGTEPYIGSPSKKEDRPQPMFGVASKNGSHRFQVWLMHEAGEREGTEWRRVIFFISPGAKSVKTRTLKTYHPTAENLKGFPSDSGAASD